MKTILKFIAVSLIGFITISLNSLIADETDQKHSNLDLHAQLRVNWDLQYIPVESKKNQLNNQKTTNIDRPIATISGSSSNISLNFAGKYSSFRLNYLASGRQSYSLSGYKTMEDWSLSGYLRLDRDFFESDTNISGVSSIKAIHKSGLRLNFNRSYLPDNSLISSGEISFTTKVKRHGNTVHGGIRFNGDNLTTTIQMKQGF